jgi:hypothetical protein
MSNFYCYEMPWGFLTCDLDVEEAPAEHYGAWSITEGTAQLIESGAMVEVQNEALVVIPVLSTPEPEVVA